jgi:hypothetical protein
VSPRYHVPEEKPLALDLLSEGGPDLVDEAAVSPLGARRRRVRVADLLP